MIVVDQNPNFRAELAVEISRVVQYLDCLERLQIDAYPKWSDWATGQRIFGAKRVQRTTTALEGLLADSRQIVTKPIQILAEQQHWARTVDGLYRLMPADQL